MRQQETDVRRENTGVRWVGFHPLTHKVTQKRFMPLTPEVARRQRVLRRQRRARFDLFLRCRLPRRFPDDNEVVLRSCFQYVCLFQRLGSLTDNFVNLLFQLRIILTKM
jgi:hypothetical protein